MLRFTNLVPNPAAAAGAVTVGPLRSVQTTTTTSSWALHDTSSRPVASESAPYFSELVASSWTTIAKVVAAPTPAASLGVAMPRYRTPKTQAISTTKGITLVNTPKLCFQEYLSSSSTV